MKKRSLHPVKRIHPRMKQFLLSVLLIFAGIQSPAQTDSLSNPQLDKRISRLENLAARLSKLKISGYIQGDWQVSQRDAWLQTNTPKPEGEGASSRFSIRRGRVKLTYNDALAGVKTKGVFQLDLTEKGVNIKDVYFAVTEPWTQWLTLQAGVFDRPFGYEISYSSSARETPERSTATLTLFPGEREVGAMLQAQNPDPGNLLNRFTLRAGLFGGNGIAQDMDNRKDLIARLSYQQSLVHSQFGAGASFYYGGVYQGTENVFEMQGKEFVKKKGTKTGDHSSRIYYGADAQYSVHSRLGRTHLRAEVVAGRQPGSSESSASPKNASLPGYDTYLRNFLGWHVYFIQDILDSRHSLVLKYDRYDPNTAISGEEIGLGGSARGDIAQSNFGIGYLFRMTSALRLMAYSNFAFNEKTSHVQTYGTSLKDNTFTMRLQYKF